MHIVTACFTMLSLFSTFRKTSSFRQVRCRLKMSSNTGLMPPDEPINFNKLFFIPVPEGKLLLEELNPHPLDSKITFNSAEHKYFYEGVQMEQSVTEFMSSFFEKFDADAIARKMISGPNWPRVGYTQRNGTPMTVRHASKNTFDIAVTCLLSSSVNQTFHIINRNRKSRRSGTSKANMRGILALGCITT